MSNLSVPFTIKNINYGFQKAHGMVRLWEQGIKLEFEVVSLGITKSKVDTVEIAYNDLQEVAYDKGWLGDSIILDAHSMMVFDDVPGTEVGTCTLAIKKKNREEGKKLVSKAQLQLSEIMLDELDD